MLYNRYKIIEIVNNTTVLIDYGFDEGAKSGDTLRIIKEGEPVIIDGVNYGALDIVKDIIEVEVPYEKFSICKKITRKNINPIDPLISLQRTMTYINPLNVDRDQMSKRDVDGNSELIKKGDIVVLTNE